MSDPRPIFMVLRECPPEDCDGRACACGGDGYRTAEIYAYEATNDEIAFLLEGASAAERAALEAEMRERALDGRPVPVRGACDGALARKALEEVLRRGVDVETRFILTWYLRDHRDQELLDRAAAQCSALSAHARGEPSAVVAALRIVWLKLTFRHQDARDVLRSLLAMLEMPVDEQSAA